VYETPQIKRTALLAISDSNWVFRKVTSTNHGFQTHGNVVSSKKKVVGLDRHGNNRAACTGDENVGAGRP
jgi:hypothetical protein